MLLTSVRVEGLASAPDVAFEALDAVQALSSPDDGVPVGALLADGLALAQSALAPSTAPARLAALDLTTAATTTLLDETLLDEVEALDPHGVAALVAPGVHRHVVVHLHLRPDPPLFRRLRDLAARDPRLLAALSSDGTLHVRVGWLFNRAGTHASVTVLAFHVGEERFPTARADRPAWMLDVLETLGTRLYAVPSHTDEATLAAAFHDALLSPSADTRAAAHRALHALAEPPFDLGALSVVQQGPGRLRLAVGDTLDGLRHWGALGLRAAQLAWVVHVVRPDVLLLEAPGDPAWRAWLEQAVTGPEATLEQVLLVGT
ncbi:MAG: hypothetical protein H6733_01025 [Alphaproteobacteria bacterium]|nr:hypothetical protein [Alphaproteobacteria bacterium]